MQLSLILKKNNWFPLDVLLLLFIIAKECNIFETIASIICFILSKNILYNNQHIKIINNILLKIKV